VEWTYKKEKRLLTKENNTSFAVLLVDGHLRAILISLLRTNEKN
jgi:hypothetical protein